MVLPIDLLTFFATLSRSRPFDEKHSVLGRKDYVYRLPDNPVFALISRIARLWAPPQTSIDEKQLVHDWAMAHVELVGPHR